MAGKVKRKAKGSLKSKTMLGNAAVIGAGVLDIVANSGMVLSALGPWGPIGLAVANMVLRTVTSEPLEDKGL